MGRGRGRGGGSIKTESVKRLREKGEWEGTQTEEEIKFQKVLIC